MEIRERRVAGLELIDQVETLNEEVKILALNLAVYLAKAKGSSKKLARLEPDFIRLVNGTVKVVQQLAHVIDAARHAEHAGEDIPAESLAAKQIEIRLRSILDQCASIMNALAGATPPES